MTFVQEYADYAIDFIQQLKHGDDFYGEPFLLLPWQKQAVEEFYGTLRDEKHRQYQYLYLEIPKKNGKSELAAALGLFHTFADEAKNGEVYVVAADRGNAGIVFRAALSMLEQSPYLSRRAVIRESQREIEDKYSGTIFKVLSSEAYSKHGYKPTCVIFDELHAQPNRDLWDVMTFGAGSARKQPVWIVLTTAGDDPDRHSIAWEVHEKAQCIIEYRKGNTKDNYDDPLWLPFIYGLPDDPDVVEKIDIFDEEIWYQCNPSLGHTISIETVRAEAENAKRSDAAKRLFLWLRLNHWIATKQAGWLPLPLFDKNMKTIPEENLLGKRCYLGLDLSKTTDLTGLVALFPPQEGLENWYARFWPWIPSDDIKERSLRDKVDYQLWSNQGHIHLTPGDCIDYEFVKMQIIDACMKYNVFMLGTDPWNSLKLSQELMEEGVVDIVEIRQTMAGMSPSMKEIEQYLRKGALQLEANPVARWNFGNIRVATDGNENIKPMKNKSIGRIDLIVALINAMAVSLLEPVVDVNDVITSGEWSF